MKQRLVCLLVFIGGLGLLSAGKHRKNNCITGTVCMQKEKNKKIIPVEVTEFELSPLFHLVFSIY